MCKFPAFWVSGCAYSGLPAFGVTRALKEDWALLQMLLCTNYSNLVAAAFNYSTEAGSRGGKQRDREGTSVWEFAGKEHNPHSNISVFNSPKTAKTKEWK